MTVVYACTVVREDAKRNQNRRKKILFCDIFIIGSISIGPPPPLATPVVRNEFFTKNWRSCTRLHYLARCVLRSSEIQKLQNIKALFLRTERSHLRWFGRVSRMLLERLSEEALLAKANGKRPAERPRTTVEGSITLRILDGIVEDFAQAKWWMTGGDRRPFSMTASFQAAVPAILSEKWALKIPREMHKLPITIATFAIFLSRLGLRCYGWEN